MRGVRHLTYLNLLVPKTYKVLFSYQDVKLQKRFIREVKKKKYYKYLIQISEKVLKEVGFKEGDELEAEVKKGEIRLKRK